MIYLVPLILRSRQHPYSELQNMLLELHKPTQEAHQKPTLENTQPATLKCLKCNYNHTHNTANTAKNTLFETKNSENTVNTGNMH